HAESRFPSNPSISSTIPLIRNLRTSAESADRTSLTAARRPKATDLDAELGGCYQVHDRTLLLEEDA
ncbi:MAG TPA: hypothetical protein DEW46_05225, partial [Verrucomicrobia bacterium]|nr:hypothetical protein [Verrucomicrobiota bacterium]